MEALTLEIAGAGTVSALWSQPSRARTALVMAHGAGAGMGHPFLAGMCEALAERGIATLRYQFPFMEARSRRTDRPEVARATVRAAVATASRLAPGLTLVAGGKSFGGRMTSQAQATAALPDVRGLAFLGFPLHPAGRPGSERSRHLASVEIPMLFLQGTRDALADLRLLRPLCDDLGPRATLRLIADADHAFHVPARSGRTTSDVMGELADAMSEWIGRIEGDPKTV